MTYDGEPIEELNDLPRLVAATPVDKSVKVTVFRDGKEREVKVKVGRLDDGEQEIGGVDKEGGGVLGITVAKVTPELAERFSLEGKEGLLITRIDPGGPAAEANLRVGDLIVEADGKGVDSVREFEEAVGKLPSGKVLRLLIQRKSTLLYTTVKLK